MAELRLWIAVSSSGPVVFGGFDVAMVCVAVLRSGVSMGCGAGGLGLGILFEDVRVLRFSLNTGTFAKCASGSYSNR